MHETEHPIPGRPLKDFYKFKKTIDDYLADLEPGTHCIVCGSITDQLGAVYGCPFCKKRHALARKRS